MTDSGSFHCNCTKTKRKETLLCILNSKRAAFGSCILPKDKVRLTLLQASTHKMQVGFIPINQSRAFECLTKIRYDFPS